MEKEEKKATEKGKKGTSNTTKKKTKKNSETNKTTTNKKVQTKKKEQQKKLINKENYLYIVFIVLIAIVVFLGVKVYQKKQTKKEETANIVIPLLKKELSYDMSIDLEELKNKDDYSIKISNFRQSNINKEEIEYKITIINDSKAHIKVTKDLDDTNLITDQASTRIEGVSLKSNQKDYAIYHFSIDGNADKIKSKDKLEINIKS